MMVSDMMMTRVLKITFYDGTWPCRRERHFTRWSGEDLVYICGQHGHWPDSRPDDDIVVMWRDPRPDIETWYVGEHPSDSIQQYTQCDLSELADLRWTCNGDPRVPGWHDWLPQNGLSWDPSGIFASYSEWTATNAIMQQL